MQVGHGLARKLLYEVVSQGRGRARKLRSGPACHVRFGRGGPEKAGTVRQNRGDVVFDGPNGSGKRAGQATAPRRPGIGSSVGTMYQPRNAAKVRGGAGV